MKKLTASIILVITFLLPLGAEENESIYLDDKKTSTTDTSPEPAMKFSGLLRNDAVISTMENDTHFADILEGRLILDYRSRKWKIYGDGRIYGYFGEAAEKEGKYRASLMRAFIRYFSPVGDFTIGKTYVNLGTPGLFNPFESNKQIIVTDISYDKEGLLAFEYLFNIGSKSGLKLYGGSDLEKNDTGKFESTYRGGGSIWTNALRFDMGLAANRLDVDRNLGGLYFKGDILIGLQGAYAVHFNDDFKSPFHEMMAGADYSFFDGKIIVSASFYFNSAGSASAGNYDLYQNLPDQYFAARYYTHGEIKYVHDEFLNTRVYALTNCIDGSTMIVPSFSIIAANGLTITLLFTTVTGDKNDEFSSDTLGRFGSILRVEGKF